MPRPQGKEGAPSLPSPRHRGGSRRLVLKGRREPRSLPNLGAWGIPLPLAMDPVVIGSRRMPVSWMKRSRPRLSRNGRLGPSGSTLSRRGGRRKKKIVSRNRGNSRRRSSHSCGGESHSKMSWSSVGSRSCWNSNDSSNSEANSWKKSSNRHHTARASRNRHRRKGSRPGRRSCQFMVLQPLRGSVQGRLLPSRLSQGEQTVWWRLVVPCAPLRMSQNRPNYKSSSVETIDEQSCFQT